MADEEKQGIKEIKFRTEDEQIIDLCKRYWAIGEDGSFIHTVTSLAKEQGMSSSNKLTNLVNENCYVYLYNFSCQECGKPFFVRTRSEYDKYMREISQGKTWTCGECLEKEADRKAALAEAEREEKRKVIQATYDVKLQPVDPHDLTFEQAVYLLALIRAGAYEDFTAIRPLDLFDTPLSPDGALNTEIMKQLYQGRLIDVHPKSLPDAFFPLIDGKIDRFYIYKVAWVWRPTVDDPDKKEPWRLAADIEAIFRSGNWPSDWIDEGQYADLWKKVALQECLVYLKHSMNEHHFDFNTGEKTNQTILSLLDDFSVGQVWNFIWRAAKDAAAYYQRGEVPKRQAANSVVGNIQRSAERAIAEGWEVKSYKRNYDFPVSAVTQVLFITALKIGEDWMAVPLKAWDEGYLRKSDTTQEEST